MKTSGFPSRTRCGRRLAGLAAAALSLSGRVYAADAQSPPPGAAERVVSVGQDFVITIRSEGIRDPDQVVRLVVLDLEALSDAGQNLGGGQSARLTQDVDCARRRSRTTSFVAFAGARESGAATERPVIPVWHADQPGLYLHDVFVRVCSPPASVLAASSAQPPHASDATRVEVATAAERTPPASPPSGEAAQAGAQRPSEAAPSTLPPAEGPPPATSAVAALKAREPQSASPPLPAPASAPEGPMLTALLRAPPGGASGDPLSSGDAGPGAVSPPEPALSGRMAAVQGPAPLAAEAAEAAEAVAGGSAPAPGVAGPLASGGASAAAATGVSGDLASLETGVPPSAPPSRATGVAPAGTAGGSQASGPLEARLTTTARDDSPIAAAPEAREAPSVPSSPPAVAAAAASDVPSVPPAPARGGDAVDPKASAAPALASAPATAAPALGGASRAAIPIQTGVGASPPAAVVVAASPSGAAAPPPSASGGGSAAAESASLATVGQPVAVLASASLSGPLKEAGGEPGTPAAEVQPAAPAGQPTAPADGGASLAAAASDMASARADGRSPAPEGPADLPAEGADRTGPALGEASASPASQAPAATPSGPPVYKAQLYSDARPEGAKSFLDRVSLSHPALPADAALYLEAGQSSGRTYTRVKAGPFASRSAASDFCAAYQKTAGDGRPRACLVLKAK